MLRCLEGLAAAYSHALERVAANPPAPAAAAVPGSAAATACALKEHPEAAGRAMGAEGLEDWDASISKNSVEVGAIRPNARSV